MAQDDRFLILREGEAEGLVMPTEALEAIEAAWRDYGTSRQVLSRPSSQSLACGDTVFKVKGAVLPGAGLAGFRLVADNRDAEGETTRDWFWLAEAAGGRPVALVEAFWLHCLRTAATGALAARMLAPPGLRRAALVGAGRIGAHLLPALAAAMPGLEVVSVASRRIEAVEAFCRRAQPGLPFALRPAGSAAEACLGAELVLTITNATAPVLHAAHLAPGATVIGLGDTEIAADVLGWADRFVVDDLSFALQTGSVAGWVASGAVTAAQVAARLDADIGELAAGLKPGRRAPGDAVLAVVQGMAVGDLATVALAWRKAREAGLGARVDLARA
ncbi:ornithine cyclodeaminase family protein [Falsiroseomonas selenitidurans]|uniref:Ornithine cyclodeaminase family protein n=1 Tax=Falsiroseomonas selenitidurans TaxID=2716335 RepID=A0ABX1EAZ3_9PROT|nr:ornithine cyclodeaminase family protein [Falsiroseomonas selenitidurans]NKC34400.1 ornithine cyclodeaminase family protein [Falsiroseomonas selenitidurans]